MTSNSNIMENESVFMEVRVQRAHTAQHERMVSLVEMMLELHKQLASARTDHERTALRRQIEAVDGQIDGVVYGLYGLTEEEVGSVKGK